MKEEGRYFGIVPFSLPFWYLKKTAQECFCMFDFGIFGIIVSCRKNVKIPKNKKVKKGVDIS